MLSAFTALVGVLILVPTIPLVLYAIGLLLPSSHIVSRSTKYNTTADILWAILTSVEDYPAWRSHIDRVTVRRDEFENEINKYDQDNRLTFVEYTKKDRRTVVMHVEQEHARKLLRVLEERPYIAPGGEQIKKSSTFSGSWTFTIEPVEGERAVILKITEQGVIKKPMVRVSHMLFFGYHRRIDRFMKDLAKEVELGILDNMSEQQQQEEEEQQQQQQEEDYEAGPDDSVLLPSKHMTESKLLDKEWDMMNEVYEKKS
ncbi:hypothetical protein CU098_006756 [Rhizopus stolonifer]|uniref:Coenzyme Q-binding protein COQ10 START domain-containing protein n=1 Tax=Rhizopus stolonifer TaxID=4846 RepID=A0A367INK7_RHIST|nr:hypothetical protein CU098_006756 [Rhizopus stolonifer]